MMCGHAEGYLGQESDLGLVRGFGMQSGPGPQSRRIRSEK